jgi:hypothetical protein
MGLGQAEFKYANFWWMLISDAKDVTFKINYGNEYLNFLRNVSLKWSLYLLVCISSKFTLEIPQHKGCEEFYITFFKSKCEHIEHTHM